MPGLIKRTCLVNINVSFLHMKSLVEELQSNKELIDWAIAASSLQTPQGALRAPWRLCQKLPYTGFVSVFLSIHCQWKLIFPRSTHPYEQTLLSNKSLIHTRYGKSQGLATLLLPLPLHRLPP